MIAVSVVIVIHGTIDVGGPSTVLNITKERGRLNFFKYVLFKPIFKQKNAQN